MDFAKKVVNTGMVTFMALILSLLGSVVLGRLLGPDGLGIYSLLRSIPAFLVTVACIGLPTAAVHFVSKEPKRRSEIAATLFLYSTVGGTIFGVGLWIAKPFLNSLYFEGNLEVKYFLLLSFLVPLMLFVRLGNSILQGLYRIAERNRVDVLIRSISILNYIALIWLLGWQLVGALVSLLIAYCTVGIYIFLLVRQDIKLILNKNIRELRYMFGYALSAYVGQFLEQMEGSILLLILGMIIEPSQLGLFTVAIGISGFVLFPSTAIARPMLPRFSRMTIRQASLAFVQVLQVGLVLSLLLSISIYVVAPYMVPLLYGSKFEKVSGLLFILLPGFLASALFSIVRVYFLSTGRHLLRLYFSIFRAVLLFMGIVIGGINAGVDGAAIGMTGAFIITFLSGLFFVFWNNPIVDFRDVLFIWPSTLEYIKAFISTKHGTAYFKEKYYNDILDKKSRGLNIDHDNNN